MDAATWLAELGYRQTANGDWHGPDLEPNETSGNDLIHAVADELWYGQVSPSEAVDLTLSLLRMIPDYAVLMYLRMAWGSVAEDDRQRVMQAFRAILDDANVEPDVREAVEYSLWVDFFEHPETQEWTFLQLTTDLNGGDLSPSSLRRLHRLLPLTGPVAWSVKAPLYWLHCHDAETAPYVFSGVLASYHDIYGQLDAEDALRLLSELEPSVPSDDLQHLRRVLQAGVTNHYRDPDAWGRAVDAT